VTPSEFARDSVDGETREDHLGDRDRARPKVCLGSPLLTKPDDQAQTARLDLDPHPRLVSADAGREAECRERFVGESLVRLGRSNSRSSASAWTSTPTAAAIRTVDMNWQVVVVCSRRVQPACRLRSSRPLARRIAFRSRRPQNAGISASAGTPSEGPGDRTGGASERGAEPPSRSMHPISESSGAQAASEETIDRRTSPCWSAAGPLSTGTRSTVRGAMREVTLVHRRSSRVPAFASAPPVPRAPRIGRVGPSSPGRAAAPRRFGRAGGRAPGRVGRPAW
jgi:hypothetical protein